jgi:hypothetical protein
MCSIDKCGNPLYAFGFCEKHYKRFKKYGDPNGGVKNHAPLEERFWRFVQKSDGCWIWTGNKSGPGYGRIAIGPKKLGYVQAHRLSWEMHNNQQIQDGMVVMHKCDNPSCVNPSHLMVGSYKENTQDMIAKGRKRTIAPVGEENGKAVLTIEQAREVKQSSLSMAALARKFGVSSNCIRGVRIGRTWKHA